MNNIFKHHWDSFFKANSGVIRDVEIKEVEKMLLCRDESRGFWTCYCSKCDEFHNVFLGCNSRLCSPCGKRYADQWAEKLVENTFDVPHKHVVFGLPPALWHELRYHRSAWKVVADSVIKVMKWFYGQTCGQVIPGVILVLHPFGRDIGFKLHVHGIITKGGFDKKGNFIEWKRFIPYKKLHRKWMHSVCKDLKKYFFKDENKKAYYRQLFNQIWFKYGKEGFVVEICKPTLYNKKQLAKYVARYVRHPAIADSRITYFDNKAVAFYYISHKTKKHVDKAMPVWEFIKAILQHIPDPQFKMIRHYGAYARRHKKQYSKHLRRSIRQSKLTNFNQNGNLKCPNCGTIMQKVEFFPGRPGKPPPDKNTLEAWTS